VDGYAVISADLAGYSKLNPVALALFARSEMGEHTTAELKSGQCAYVPTGGELPSGADAAVMLEEVSLSADGKVTFTYACHPGTNLIKRGEDMQPGELVIPAGKKLKIADIGTLAAMGKTQISVFRQPVVGIIATGNELVPSSQPLAHPGLIRDVNSPMVNQAVLCSGGIPKVYGIFRDDRQELTRVIGNAVLECDILIITGGTSMDANDLVQLVIGELGEIFIHGITLKPGKPTIAAAIDNKPVFGLPGNPVSAFFTFHLFIRPLIHSLQGFFERENKISAPLARPVVNTHGREEYLPVILRDGLVHPVASKSGLITTVSCADGYIIVPSDCRQIPQGQIVDVTLLEK
jgi:molybdopterin molybdotransferase